MIHKQTTLPFEYDALEPFIDAKTKEIRHSKHHQGNVNKLNAAIKGTEYAGKLLEEILKNASLLPTGIRNNGGGHYNHSLYWEILSPEVKDIPDRQLADAINNALGSFKAFKEQFADAAGGRFGSGWAWMCGSMPIT